MLFKKKYNMTNIEADKTLQNVFAACDQQPNETSFERIRVRSIAGTTVVKTGLLISYIFLLLVLVAPLPFIDADQDSVKHEESSGNITIVSHSLEKGIFTMAISGDDVSFDGIYCKRIDGEIVFPIMTDPSTGTVTLPFDGRDLNIFIPCKNGDTIQALLYK